MLQKGRGTSAKTTLGPNMLGFLRPCEHVLQFSLYFYHFYLEFGPGWDAFSFQSGGHQSQTRQTPKSHFGHFGFSNFERSTSNVPQASPGSGGMRGAFESAALRRRSPRRAELFA